MLRLIVLLEIKSYCNTRRLWHEGLYSKLPRDRAHFYLHCGEMIHKNLPILNMLNTHSLVESDYALQALFFHSSHTLMHLGLNFVS